MLGMRPWVGDSGQGDQIPELRGVNYVRLRIKVTICTQYKNIYDVYIYVHIYILIHIYTYLMHIYNHGFHVFTPPRWLVKHRFPQILGEVLVIVQLPRMSRAMAEAE